MIKFQNFKGLTVRIYEGQSRESAFNPLVQFNEQPILDSEYRVKWNSGLLIVAIPDKDVDTEFEFNYWVQDKAA